MPGESSNAAAWSTLLTPPPRPDDLVPRRDDPRLGEIIETWDGRVAALHPGRAVLIGFPQDEGVRRNHGRPGAAHAPAEIRRWLWRLTPYDAANGGDLTISPPLDLGDVRCAANLEESQESLARIVAVCLQHGAAPIVLGGGHETAYGHYLGYVAAGRPVGIINIDAHLDLRPLLDDLGHSGSPFRQALEHPTAPLPGPNYVCLGALPHATSRAHLNYALQRGAAVRWRQEFECGLELPITVEREASRLAAKGCQVYVTLDADVVRVADVPGVSAPNSAGLAGDDLLAAARIAGKAAAVSSFDLVEINPSLDRDGQSARWAALVVWNFLMGLSSRSR
jgi:formiminoglutamase